MAEFLHIFVSPKAGTTQEQLAEKMNLAVDWYRYQAGVYLVYTTSSIENWKERLLPLVEPDGSLFIAKLDIKGYQGWMTQNFWDWINAKTKNV